MRRPLKQVLPKQQPQSDSAVWPRVPLRDLGIFAVWILRGEIVVWPLVVMTSSFHLVPAAACAFDSDHWV